MMNKILLFSLCCTLCSYPYKADAQILKKIGKKIEQSVENRVDRKINQGIEKGLDKAEDGTEKAVADAVSSDKKSEAIALPEDYQIEISGSGADVYVEYRMHVDNASSEDYQMNMLMKLYTSPQNGHGRAETVMNLPVVGEMKMSMITDMNNPLRVIMLNDRKKQYTVIDYSESTTEKLDDKTYTVKRLGTANVRGLDCIHAEAIGEDGERFEIWTTREIPGYEDMVGLYSKSQHMGSDGLWKAMQDAGCDGFMVKLKVDMDDAGSVMELVKMQRMNIPASTFTVPDGYEEKKGAWVDGFLK